MRLTDDFELFSTVFQWSSLLFVLLGLLFQGGKRDDLARPALALGLFFAVVGFLLWLVHIALQPYSVLAP